MEQWAKQNSIFIECDKLLIAGYTDTSFEEPTNGFFVSFDASIGVKGKAT